jgi:acetylornithine aminotransferase
LLEQGLIVNVPGPDTLRMLPPLVIGEAEVDEALQKLRAVLG